MSKQITPGELAQIVAMLLTDVEQSGCLDERAAFEQFMTDIAEVVCNHCGGEIHHPASFLDDVCYVGIHGNESLPENGGIWKDFDVEGALFPDLAPGVLTQPILLGKLWWNAENMHEAETWKAGCLARGAIDVQLIPEKRGPMVRVIVTLDRNRANEIAGYEVEEAEWLDLSEEGASPGDEQLSEDELASFMLQRIETGDLDLEDIPVRLARYGLMQPEVFVTEMRERMALAKADGYEAL